MKRYFITGTDTNCGKTWVTTQLLSYLSNAIALKPIASGCEWVGDELVNEDAKLIHNITKMPLSLINPWRFSAPVSPHIAAEMEGVRVSAAEISDYVAGLNLTQSKLLLIEGAGGLMVPLNATETWIDFLKLSNIPVILVVGITLGCINHALLTQAVLERFEIPCAGWIANMKDNKMLAVEQNLITLKNKLNIPLLAIMKHGGGIDDFFLNKL